MITRYERDVPVFLSLYRFIAFGLAVILTQVLPLNSPVGPSPETYLLLGVVGLYTVLKVAGPTRAWRSGRTGLVLLWIDLVICLTLLLATGGLDSAYLLYSLAPITTASLLFSERLALSVTTLSAAVVLLAHLTPIWWDTPFAPLTLENRLFWMILFVMSSFLMATMVYRTNLNLRNRIQFAATEEERKRMRAELHDGLAQSLGYMRMQTELVVMLMGQGRLQEAKALLEDVLTATEDTYQEVRETLDHLQVDIGPIAQVLKSYVATFREQSGIDAEFQATPTDIPLPAPIDFQLLRIAQEALSNVRRHSGATQVRVELKANRLMIELVIRDNGKGFEEDKEGPSPAGHHGLVVMRERAESLGGTLKITSAPGLGTLVRAVIPIAGRKH